MFVYHIIQFCEIISSLILKVITHIYVIELCFMICIGHVIKKMLLLQKKLIKYRRTHRRCIF